MIPFNTVRILSTIETPTPAPAKPEPGILLPTGLLITLGVTVTIGGMKWLIDKMVEGWEKRFEDLEAKHEVNEAIGKDFAVLQQRFENLSGAFIDLQKLYQDQQKELLRTQKDLASSYLRRDDWIRFSNSLEAKMDGLNRKMDDRLDAIISRLGR